MDRLVCNLCGRHSVNIWERGLTWIQKSRRWASTNQGASLHKLKRYLKTEHKAIEKLKEEFAMPFVNLDKLLEDVDSNYSHKPSTNILYNAASVGRLHWPAVDMGFIQSNAEKLQEGIKNRKLPDAEIDIRKHVIAPYQSLLKLRNEIKLCEEEKDGLTMSMKEFWSKRPKHEKMEVPPTIAETRQKAVELGCYISLLNWIQTELEKFFYEKALLLPNMTHPSVPVGDECAATVLKVVGDKPGPDYNPVGHTEVGERTGIIRQKDIATLSGQRTYFLCNEAADLEQALIRYTLDKLRSKGFDMISCPNILHGSVFEACGIASTKIGDMLYGIDPQSEDFYISGTSEVGIASYFASHAVSLKNLPIKLCCVSTCNRKETDNRKDPRGLYRVHHFLKVEMFGVTANETGRESEALYNEFVSIQEELFMGLGLHFRIMNMPSGELGLPAYQKADIEAWMAGRNSYGEISSASNCTDFQSRRLHILYKTENEYKFAHTINGTACAVPRVIIALLENNQTKDLTVELPAVLHPYMEKSTIRKSKRWTMEYIGPNQSKNKQKTPKP